MCASQFFVMQSKPVAMDFLDVQSLFWQIIEKIEKIMIPAPVSNFLQNYFDKIFVITIERATDRQSEVTNNWKDCHLNFFME
jgi:hypothetical protein